MLKITVEPSLKWPKFDQYLAQIQPNWLKMTLKMVKNHENYTGFFNFLPKMANFWTFGKCQKCNEIFGLFLQKAVHFPQNVSKFETLRSHSNNT